MWSFLGVATREGLSTTAVEKSKNDELAAGEERTCACEVCWRRIIQ